MINYEEKNNSLQNLFLGVFFKQKKFNLPSQELWKNCEPLTLSFVDTPGKPFYVIRVWADLADFWDLIVAIHRIFHQSTSGLHNCVHLLLWNFLLFLAEFKGEECFLFPLAATYFSEHSQHVFEERIKITFMARAGKFLNVFRILLHGGGNSRIYIDCTLYNVHCHP